MSKKRFLIPLAAFSLLLTSVVACNGNNNNNNPSSSGAPAGTSSQSGGGGGAGGSSSSQATAHTHDYNATASSTVKNADDKDVSLFECKDNDGGKVIAIAFADYSEKSADFGSTSGYSNVPQELRNSSFLIAKNATVTWKVNVDKAITGAKLSFGVVYTGSDHNTQTGSDGGTVKYSFKVNDGSFVDWGMGSNTYEGCGLSQSARKDYVFGSIDLVAGENTITVRQNNAGYRLLFGGDVKIFYEGEAVPVAAPFAGYDVSFVTSHCTVLAYESGQDYTAEPVALTNGKTKARDENGEIVAYDTENPNAAQPQVNFKVVPEAGYEVDTTCIAISGTPGTDWNSLKDAAGTEIPGDPKTYAENTFRVTKIKGNLTITVTAAAQGTLNPGYAISFNLEHCTVQVYKEKGFKNVETDAGPVFYSRNKTKDSGGDYPYCKGENAQFSFVITPETGYEWKPNLPSNEVEAELVSFISPNGYNKLKVTDGLKCNLTKVSRNLTINISCTQIVA